YEINILELGFGTGLNVLVTINEYLKTDKNHIINYFTLEKYPINESEINDLAYFELFDNSEFRNIYQKIHLAEWEKSEEIISGFNLKKIECDFFDLKNIDLPAINLVYFDCFGARVQPDLWEKPLFEMVADKMAVNGLLTTYSSKGSVRRILQELNFNVEKKQGPPGKREMINAVKL
ncbi:tRNA (5-methylaminomethyl-2-thiouridine)(34)-methyltransferase MnmD, partial [Chryseobacterium sp. HMWF001]